MWQQWTNALLGVWILAIPFFGFPITLLTWTLLVTGLVVALLAIWGAGKETSERGHIAELEMEF